MCGIAGLIGIREPEAALYARATNMLAALNHRGPDDQGMEIAPEDGTAFVHTRLTILDLSAAGHQPMLTDDGRYWITFNGEIYNFPELREKLQQRGVVFRSHSDTEVLLHMYVHYGVECLNQLQGMFAFAIWDRLEKTCFLARDPLGIKPLYYWHQGDRLVFASEIRALVASGLPPKRLDPQGLYGYLLSGSVPEPCTLLSEVFCLEAGHYLHFQAGSLRKRAYWRLDFSGQQPFDSAKSTQITRKALLESVSSHLLSDVPVGLFLSGGLDSTALLALAREVGAKEISTFSLSFTQQAWNEGGVAKQVAKHFGSKHHEMLLTGKIARHWLDTYLGALDQPSIDGFNTYCVSRFTSEQGMKVILSGLGGDELFGGYSTFQRFPQLSQIGFHLKKFAPLSAMVGYQLEKYASQSRWRRLGSYLQKPADVATTYYCLRGVFTLAEAKKIVKRLWPEVQALPDNPSFGDDLPTNSVDLINHLEWSQYLRNQLLRDSDVMSMASGLELRVPFVDRHLFGTIASIPPQWRLEIGKKLLIKAVPEIPDFVQNRPKQGFSFPFTVWLQGEWTDWFAQASKRTEIPLTNWYQSWSLISLQSWWERIQVI